MRKARFLTKWRGKRRTSSRINFLWQVPSLNRTLWGGSCGGGGGGNWIIHGTLPLGGGKTRRETKRQMLSLAEEFRRRTLLCLSRRPSNIHNLRGFYSAVKIRTTTKLHNSIGSYKVLKVVSANFRKYSII